jgi:hypothetical protein
MAFMPGGISWICKELEMLECGAREDFDLYEASDWLTLLQEYSAKDMTYPSDRLKAIRGMVAELEQSRNDRYFPDYGVWEDQLVEQLLWRRDGACLDPGSLDLPSWSWAATGCRKIWCPHRYDVMLHHMPRSLGVTWSGRLRASGHLSSATKVPRYTPMSAHPSLVEYVHERIFEDNVVTDTSFAIWDTVSGSPVLGFASFDLVSAIPHAQCFVISAMARRNKRYYRV